MSKIFNFTEGKSAPKVFKKLKGLGKNQSKYVYRHAFGVGWGGILSIGVGKVAETGRFFRSIVMRHF
ncbi:MAG: hypothetical protein ACJAXQ_001199 [Parvibaculaceae bacterium]|jgi:hypothetical protein